MGRLDLLTSLAWRNLWRNPRRTALTFVAIGVGVWSMIVLAAIMEAWGASAFDAAMKMLTGHGQIHAAGYLDDPTVDHRFPPPEGELKRVLESAPARAWAMRVRVPAIVQTARETAPVTLVGIDPQSERGLSFIPEAVHEGEYLEGNSGSDVLLGRKLAQRLRTGIGKRVVILSQAASGEIAERGFRVVGLFETEQERDEKGFVFVPRTTAQTMLGIGDDVSEISFLLDDVTQLPAFLERARDAAPGLDAVSWSTLEPFTQAILDISNGTVELWTVIMFVLVAFGLVNTLLMAVFERMREFGLVQALGLQPHLLLVQVLIESAFLIGLGVAAGVVGGIATLVAFRNGLDLSAVAQGGALFGIGRRLYPHVNGQLTVLIALFVWLMGIVTSLYPAWRAAREVPVETITRAST
jgi:ABC-type lipoprotein release transport system permease subunit